jgi:hypothetical protein
MSEINRSLIILRPKQPFLDWARSLDDESKDITLESLNEDSTAYLISEIWQDSDQEEFLKPAMTFSSKNNWKDGGRTKPHGRNNVT